MLSRRTFLAGFACTVPALVAGCTTTGDPGIEPVATPAVRRRSLPPEVERMYASILDERHQVPSLDLDQVDPDVLRQVVPYDTPERAGTIIVNTDERRLYLVMERGRAMRYGVGVGQEGLEWSGRARVGRTAIWPRWTPTAAMIRRDPRNAPWAKGMEGGLQNPLGARALYLYEGSRDTMYRLHGTHEPWSIGRAVSSGCIRLFNHDIIDLERRVTLGTPVVVLS